MAFVIENRPDLRRAFYRLLAISPQDEALTEHDSEVQETVHYFLQSGLWNSQYYLLTNTPLRKWITQQGPLSNSVIRHLPTVEWTPSPEGGKYIDLPDDFIRLVGDDDTPAFYTLPDRRAVGREISHRDRNRARGTFSYWLENEQVRVGDGANIPNKLYYEYYARHPVLDTDEDEIDFPVDIRPLIVAEAAVMALAESWLPFEDQESESRVLRNLAYWRGVATSRGRQTRTRQKLRGRRNPYGTGWF